MMTGSADATFTIKDGRIEITITYADGDVVEIVMDRESAAGLALGLVRVLLRGK